MDACLAEYGRIDVLVNSAGIADKHKPVNRCDEDWYDLPVWKPNENGDIVRSTDQAPVGSSVSIAVTDGSLLCRVEGIEDIGLLGSTER